MKEYIIDDFNFLNADGWKQFFERIQLDTNLRNVIYKLTPALLLEFLWTLSLTGLLRMFCHLQTR